LEDEKLARLFSEAVWIERFRLEKTTEVFGITSVVVSKLELTQQTFSNRQEFKLSLLSDLPFEIRQAAV
jgi:hypothetical protein